MNFLENLADMNVRVPMEVSLGALLYAVWTVATAHMKMKFMRRDLNEAFKRIRKLEEEK